MHSHGDEAIYDVVVIGCGLTGATVANLLGQLQVRTLVVERDQAVYVAPRAIVLDDEVLRILQAVGIGEHLAELTAPLENARYINGAGRVLFDDVLGIIKALYDAVADHLSTNTNTFASAGTVQLSGMRGSKNSYGRMMSDFRY